MTVAGLAAWSQIAHEGMPDTSMWLMYTEDRPVTFLWEQDGNNPNPPTTTVPFFNTNL